MDGTNQTQICIPQDHCTPPDAGMPDSGHPDAGQASSDGGSGDAQPEVCLCDLTTACDKNCPCDPDCKQGSGGGKSCGCTMVASSESAPAEPVGAAPVLSLLAMGVALALRKKRHVH
jgi:hypothetical protein